MAEKWLWVPTLLMFTLLVVFLPAMLCQAAQAAGATSQTRFVRVRKSGAPVQMLAIDTNMSVQVMRRTVALHFGHEVNLEYHSETGAVVDLVDRADFLDAVRLERELLVSSAGALANSGVTIGSEGTFITKHDRYASEDCALDAEVNAPGTCLSEAQARRADFPDLRPADILVGFVVDSGPFATQAVALLRSLRWLGGSLGSRATGAHVLALVLPSVESRYRVALSSLGAEVREVPPLASSTVPGATPHSNKIRLLEQPEARDTMRFRAVLYLDCDVVVLGDPFLGLREALRVEQAKRAHPLSSPVLYRSGRVAWGDLVLRDPAFRHMAELAGVDAAEHARVFGWPNTGVLVLPTSRVARLLEIWIALTDKVATWLSANGEDAYFVDTVALSLALGVDARALVRARVIEAAHETVRLLPVQLNTQLNLPLRDFERNGFQDSLRTSPALLLHGNQRTIGHAECGKLREFDETSLASFPFLVEANARVRLFNELVMSTGAGPCG